MQASIYRVCERGVRLPHPQQPVTGELSVVAERRGDESMLVARLLGAGKTENLPALFKARVSKVTSNGMVIHGIEFLTRGQQKSRVHQVPQTWWAFIHTDQGLYRYDGHDPLGNTIADRSATGF